MSDLAQTLEDYAEEYLRQKSKIRRGSDFLSGQAKRPPALFNGLIPERTLTMISSEPGCGKTALTLSMALSLSTGQPLLGYFAPRELRRVFYLGQDAPDWDYAELFRKLAAGYGVTEKSNIEVDFLLNEGGNFADRRFLAELQAWHEHASYDVIIFDTLASFHSLDENDTRQMGAIMAILKRLRDQLKCSVLFTHHTRKPQKDEVISQNYAARGNTVISGSIDFHIALRRVRRGQTLMTCAKGRGPEKLPDGFGFNIEERDGWMSLKSTQAMKTSNESAPGTSTTAPACGPSSRASGIGGSGDTPSKVACGVSPPEAGQVTKTS